MFSRIKAQLTLSIERLIYIYDRQYSFSQGLVDCCLPVVQGPLRTTPRSAPWILSGYCNFTVFLLLTNFIVNFAEHPVTQGGFITYTHTSVQPLPQLQENRLKNRKENVAR